MGNRQSGRGARFRARAALSASALSLLLAGECVAAPYLRWGIVKHPTQTEVVAAWPAEAAKAGIEGSAATLCEVSRAGLISECRVIAEAPVGHGFGEALLGLSSAFGAKPVKQLCSEYFHQIVIDVDWTKTERSATWATHPNSRDYSTAFPEEAYRHAAGGATVLWCAVKDDGGMKDCRVVYDSTPGWGFAAASLSIAPKFSLKPKEAGKPLPPNIAIPLNFKPYNGVMINC